MIIKLQTPKKALNKAFLKQRPLRSEIDLFKSNLMRLLGCIDEIEREENQKNHIRDFLRDTYYKGVNEINTKDSKDLVIHIGKTNKDNVGVIVEAKRPSNTSEMISEKKPNAKALHEIILYYLDERNNQSNNELKNLIITNVYDWYIFDANVFDKYIYRNTKIKKLYDTYVNDKKDTPFFYEEVSKIIADLNIEIPCVNFDIRSYQKHLKDSAREDDKQLIALYKILSPYHLLKVKFADDSNKLDELFYKELLHIIGLEEVKDGSKNIIRRKLENRNDASLLENAIDELKTEGLHKITDLKSFGETSDEQYFNVALELCITWINRILFLKLLEGQLINYHGGDKSYRFLYKEMIFDYDELYKLFHKVLAVNIPERTTKIQEKYSHVPYLNSSLFEISELEDQTIRINSLDDSLELEILSNSVLKEKKKKTDKLLTIDYFFQFLDAYDFASEGSEEIQENSKSLINASVLGKVFEKLNGYKDGSIYTPGFITMYMCRQSIRLAVVQKFKDTYGWNIDQFEDIRNYLADRRSSKDILEFNQLINSVRLVDPAVGSGHFLVSALNELIAIKHDLGVFADETGSRLSSFEFEIANDELIVTDAEGDIFEYKYINGKPTSKDSQRLQKTLFHEKQNIIENCLFGVDLNPNSVKICRLRLWIELLKNAYYRESGELETLPNIDINIKCGNSLISRFPLDADLKKALKSIKYDINAYRGFVQDYKNEKNREVKKGLQVIIDSIKNDFRSEIFNNDPKILRHSKLGGELYDLLNQQQMFEEDNKQKKIKKEKQIKIETEIKKLAQEIDDIKSNVIYKNAFEWRFEFPEVLDDNGDFNGFDIVIGNPPYIQLQSMGQDTDALARVNYKTFARTGDIYSLFYEKGNEILKQQGYLSFITSNKWMRADYGLKTRQYIAEQTNPLYLIDFGMVLVFDNATVLSNILTFQKTNNLQQLKAIRTPDGFDLHTPLDEYFTSKSTDVKVDENAWVIQEGAVQLIKAKVEKQGIPLNKWDITINRGILTGYNDAFVINSQIKNKLIKQDSKSAEIIKPLLRGRDIQKYNAEYCDLWLIATFPSKSINIEEYPAVSDFLKGFKPKLEQTGSKLTPNEKESVISHALSFGIELKTKDLDKARKATPNKWFEIQDSIAYWQDFEKEKIIYPNMTKFLPFVFDKGSFYTNDKTFIITGNQIAYLTAFFNSKLFRFCFRENFPELLGGTMELRKVFFDNINVKPVDDNLNNKFKELIERLIINKNNGIETLDIENEIESEIYNIYDINIDEQKIIQEANV